MNIADVTDRFTWVEGTREWRVEGRLAEKVKRWKEEEREEEERRRMRKRWVGNAMDVDLEEETEDSEAVDGEVDEEIKHLKVKLPEIEIDWYSCLRLGSA